MINIQTGVVLTNPNTINTDRHIMVKLHSTGQEVKAMIVYSVEQDRGEQNPQVKVSSEVFLLVDDRNSFYCIGSTSQGINLVDSKIYKIENDDKVEVLTENLQMTTKANTPMDNMDLKTQKISVKNSTDDLIAIVSDMMDTIIAMKTVVTAGSSAGSYGHDKTGDISALKAKWDAFKV